MIRNWASVACAAFAALATAAVIRGLESWAWVLVLALPPWDKLFKTLSSWTEEAAKIWVAGQQAREEREKLAELEKVV